MDVFEAIQKRKSIRRYKEKPIPEELIEKILDAGKKAPSAGNIHPEIFVVVKEQEVKEKIASAALNQTFITKSPTVIVVCADVEKSERYYGMRGRNLYCIQDTAAAIENMLLLAAALGIGSCWVGAYDEHKISGILNLPENVRPLAIIPFGYPGR